MSRSRLVHRLTDPEAVIMFDGAMGTMLYARGVFINQCYDDLCVRSPELVRDVHAAYVRAGAEALETNSFGANRLKLSQFGLAGDVVRINQAAARLAREAAGDERLVAGAIGPLGARLEPYGPTSAAEAHDIFAEQMSALRDGGSVGAGVDCFILETFGDLDEIAQAVAAARTVDPSAPVVAQMTIGVDGLTAYGATPEEVALALDGMGADVIGLNCSVGPQTILEAIERMAAVTHRKLSAIPNAGMPRGVGGRTMYMASPEYMASYARHLVNAGAKVIGGCCGTTPEHIHAMVEGIRPLVPRLGGTRRSASDGSGTTAVGAASGGGAVTATARVQPCEPIPLAARSRFGAKLACGQFLTSVEIVPPRGVDADRMLTDARALAAAGVDAINVPDGPRAQSRMGAMMTSLLIEQQAGIETVCHYACRDRNLLGMLSDLLGASAMGLRNMLLITGDPPKMGPYPDATAVFDIDAIGLTNLVRNLNHGLDPGGHSIGAPTRYVIGVGVNPAAVDPAIERKRFAYKVEAGAEFAITQPVFDTLQLERFLQSVESDRIPIIAGIWPLVSVRNAEFLANEVPGVVVPDAVISRMRRASDTSKEHALAEGVSIAQEMLARVRDAVQGVQVSAPFGRVELALRVLAPTQ